jgi:hypothetical protein
MLATSLRSCPPAGTFVKGKQTVIAKGERAAEPFSARMEAIATPSPAFPEVPPYTSVS